MACCSSSDHSKSKLQQPQEPKESRSVTWRLAEQVQDNDPTLLRPKTQDGKKDGAFLSHVNKTFGEFLTWQWNATTPNFDQALKSASTKIPQQTVDLARLHATSAAGKSGEQLLATWLGHATFLVQSLGINILTDPVFSERCSPVGFAGPKRFVPVPAPINTGMAGIKLLPHIHIVTLSHDHQDHINLESLQTLQDLFQPIFVCARRTKQWLISNVDGLKNEKVVELDWWEKVRFEFSSSASSSSTEPTNSDNIDDDGAVAVIVTATPARHWCQRGPLDRNHRLWMSLVVEVVSVTETKRPETKCDAEHLAARWFHCGDTGWQEDMFRQIGRKFGAAAPPELAAAGDKNDTDTLSSATAGAATAAAATAAQQQQSTKPFDLALIPIGAYGAKQSRWFLADQHTDPDEAALISLCLGRPTLCIGMHWGTFLLTDEEIDSPPVLLAAAKKKYNIADSDFVTLAHGATCAVPLRRSSQK